MSDFEKRLEKALERGQRTGRAKEQQAAAEAMSEEEFKRLHTQYRLELSEHIEGCLSRLPNHIPGFQYRSVVSERGWGAQVQRDDVGRGSGGGRDNFFSRLVMLIRPFGQYHVLDLTAKGTVRNQEVFNRNHYQKLDEADADSFRELIDLWVLEYAELYAAKS